MKNFVVFLLLFAALLLGRAARAQGVGVGTATPDASAALDVSSTARGLLVPRLTAAQRAAIITPATGLLVFQTDGAQAGFWFNAGPPAAPAWTFINPAGGGGGGDNLGNHTATTALNLQANALTGTGASIGAAVGLGVRADGGLNLGQNGGGANVFLGYQAGQATTPSGTTFRGRRNLFSGYQAGAGNTTGGDNLFSGYRSGFANTTGNTNLFVGYLSGAANTTANLNQFVGHESGTANTTGNANHFIGYRSGFQNTSGSRNQFEGYAAGFGNTSASDNQFSGYQSGINNTTGNQNLFVGSGTGSANTAGGSNQFIGFESGYRNTTGSFNFFSGFRSGYNNTTGGLNQFEGYQSGFNNAAGGFNTFEGYQSGFNNTTGGFNQFSGYQSGINNTTGGGNWAFGFNAGPATGNLTNAGALGSGARVSQSNSLVLGGTGGLAVRVGIGTEAPADRLHVYGNGPTILRLQNSEGTVAFDVNRALAGMEFWANPQGSATEWRPALIRAVDGGSPGGYNGGLVFYTNGFGFANRNNVVERMRVRNGGVNISGDLFITGSGRIQSLFSFGPIAASQFITGSDQRLKTAVRPLRGGLAGALALRPVRYRWNEAGIRRGGLPGEEQIGLLAQQVEEVYPELVGTAPDGYKGVNYAQLTPVLLAAVQELAAENAALRRQLEQDRQQFQQRRRQDRAAAEAQAAGFAQRLRALEAAGAQAAAGPR